MSKLYFFRHAQASYLADNYDKLSSLGEKQAAKLGQYLSKKNIHFDKVFVGPLVRQQHTLEIVSDIYSKKNKIFPSPVLLQELKEHAGPEAMKKVLPELVKTVPKIHQLFDEIKLNPLLTKKNTILSFQYFMEEWAMGNIEVEGIEPWSIFRQEVKKGLEAILHHTKRGECIAIFSSGGTISSIIAEALNMQDESRIASLNFSIRNTSFSRFLFSKNQFNLLSFNELPHLEEELISFV